MIAARILCIARRVYPFGTVFVAMALFAFRVSSCVSSTVGNEIQTGKKIQMQASAVGSFQRTNGAQQG